MNLRKITKAVAYLRVSTDKQGQSGLGLEAQRDAVARYAAANSVDLIGEHIEVETGKGANALSKRPELVAALATAKREKAGLIIAKLDRLARNVHFISGLMETGVEFAVADMPNADRFQLHLFAALAEKEAEVISHRTKAALAAAKARGTVLGKHGKTLAAANKAEAMDRLEPISADLLALKAEGLSIRKMVEALNSRAIPSPAGGKWHPASLHKALARLEAR
ncbi:recombinase family protein [Sphingobium yanoikuyae]|jgi:DNA invertase Pin-like site-specific DNA recombinase|uniref:Recombinase family protein n=1 Tax=Sphingobium yanoikuyae TaxID=13690 RepID=A0AA42WZY6_SPHYA|nr:MULTISPECIES: recombinase family protein [Sphingobium]RSU73812.1 resolvase [Sphingomonas sp. S-NIH.Pt3_0716]MDH2133277.1 recombinase family protein [Sphingobium yanoikuyae]MDH2150408.1 recombinase family protein [Sphingobium yanoikuyae]MDH2165541.1 recombinase family protein [Sphingobium yanoikuyae]QCB36987.1 recombinase family protein [Sphingobium sp. PAMC28499]